MFDALAAEALKMPRHKATWFLVWLYPIGFSVILMIAIVAGMAGADQPEAQGPAGWIGDTAAIWGVPGNSLGRYLMSAYVAVMFAGEYGWNTWKLIVPHRSRTSLLAAKYALALILFAAAFILTAILTIFFSWADNLLNGEPLPAGITAGALWEVHSKAALAALAPTLVALGYASLAAILTRSTIAALVIAIVMTTIEQVIFSFGPMLSIRFPGLTPFLYQALPGYHIANLAEWVREGAIQRVPFPSGRIVAFAWTTSLAVVAGWLAVLFGATFAAFRRQDLN